MTRGSIPSESTENESDKIKQINLLLNGSMDALENGTLYFFAAALSI